MKIYTFEEISLMNEDIEFITVTTNQKVRVHNGHLQIYSFGEWVYCLEIRRWMLEGYKLLN